MTEEQKKAEEAEDVKIIVEAKKHAVQEPVVTAPAADAVPQAEPAVEAEPGQPIMAAEPVEGEIVEKIGAARTGDYEDERKVWVPKTVIGKKVQAGEITNLDDILRTGAQIMEPEIVDALLPGLNEEVVSVRRVQRTLDSGRRMKFSIMAVVGDKNGHVGVGLSKGVEAGPTIKKAVARAKLNIIEVKRGCSSWECGCGEPHTVPYKVMGKMGSVVITLKPAPKGVGQVVGENAKVILDFAGIKDVWVFSKGHSRTVINQVLAIYDGLRKMSTLKEETSKKAKDKKPVKEKKHKE